jgi:heptosyltransferase II
MNPQSAIRNLQSQRILVRGVNWLGDAVMTTPALLRLRERFPEAHITLLTPEKLRDLWLHHPAINEIITFGAGDGLFSVGRKLREGNFDLALVLPNSPRSALEVWLADIPQRVGCARPWRNCFLTQTVAPRADAVKMQRRSTDEIETLVADNSKLKTQNSKLPPSAHQVHEYLHLVAALGANHEPLAPLLSIAPEEIEAAKKKFALEKIAEPIFGLNPGAEYGPAKRWPVERFIAAAREIQQKTKCTWILYGGNADTDTANYIASQLPFANSHLLNLAGQTSLRELMALLKSCRVLLTNDSGPMHVAAALGTPVVVPFGSTSPELTGPGLPDGPRHGLLKSDAPCSPCFRRTCPIDFRCMTGISVERIVEAVLVAAR